MRRSRTMGRRRLLSWTPIDENYVNRAGYDREFLETRVDFRGPRRQD